jgi:hypothetical protein
MKIVAAHRSAAPAVHLNSTEIDSTRRPPSIWKMAASSSKSSIDAGGLPGADASEPA